MGIKNFSKMFKPVKQIQIINMVGERIAIDAFWKIYQAILGLKNVDTLTDKYGNPTAHIQILLSNIIQMHRSGIKQIWVFDFCDMEEKTNQHHNPAKQGEIEKRRQKRDVNQTKINALTLEMFKNSKKLDFDDALPDQESETKTESDKQKTEFIVERDTQKIDGPTKEQKSTQNIQTEIDVLKKRSYQIKTEQIDDIKKILDLLGIPYINGIRGYEGEHIASYLVQQDMADAVFSGDSDPLAFGAKKLYRKIGKDIFEYTLLDIFNQIKTNANIPSADMEQFRKISVIMGTDNCEKTHGVGPRTVFSKFATINLVESQRKAIAEFSKLDQMQLELKINNKNVVPFEKQNIDKLIEWLTIEKGFNKNKLIDLLSKASTPIKSKAANLFDQPKQTEQKAQKHKTTEKVPKKTAKKEQKIIILDEDET